MYNDKNHLSESAVIVLTSLATLDIVLVALTKRVSEICNRKQIVDYNGASIEKSYGYG